MAPTSAGKSAGDRIEQTELLIVGAGPFGLAMAAHADRRGIDHIVVGRPMSFWREHMPSGMLLRSGCDWHLDPDEEHTLEAFLATSGRRPQDVEPLSLECYLQYADWFQERKGIRPRPALVNELRSVGPAFEAILDDGGIVASRRVVLALGFGAFANVPDRLAALVPADKRSHTCDVKSFDGFAGGSVLIVGGRQSAFESAALLAEAGAREVHVCHRHDTPSFESSDWSWVTPLLERIAAEPDWYRSLPESERAALDTRFWTEGRLKLEPWLAPRLDRPEISIRPSTEIVACESDAGPLLLTLDDGSRIRVDHVLLATGYKPSYPRIPILEAGALDGRIECRDGFPVLDASMQTTVEGLHVTSLPATRDFGLFFAFTAAVRASARIIGRAL